MRMRELLILSVLPFLLIGCGEESDIISSLLNTYVENSIYSTPEIIDDSEYGKCGELYEKDFISNEGYYESEKVDYNILNDQKLNHISFGSNSFIDIEYFSDPEMTNNIDTDVCYMSGGNCIYYRVNSIHNPNTDSYEFIGFKVLEFDETKNASVLANDIEISQEIAYQIPTDFEGKELTLLPLGQYIDRNILLDDYFKDINGQINPLDGYWKVNEIKTNEGSVSIGSTIPYIVTYQYNPDEYEYISSNPTCIYNNGTEGEITFEEFTADQGINSISVELRKKDDGIYFDPSKYSIEHADIEYLYLGNPITEPILIPDGDFIEYRITNVENGYWTPVESTGRLEVGSDIKNTIQGFVNPKRAVIVKLPQPKRGGTITYLLNDKEITDNQVSTDVGNVIKMRFNPKNGWSCNEEDNISYRVIDKDVQIVTFEGNNIDNVFFESDYLPLLTLNLDKSVELLKFSIEASGLDENIKKSDLTISDKPFSSKVATLDDLRISVQGSLKDSKAIRFKIDKEKDTGEKDSDIQYIPKSPSHIDVVLYDANDNSIIENINITAEIVDVEKIEIPSIPYAYFNLSTKDLSKSRVLKEGDPIEGNRSIEVKIVPKVGYYIKGSDSDKYYSDTMKYSQYQADLNKIIEKHPAKRFCHIILNDDDAYGSVKYKVDGEEIPAGEYDLREENSLEMIYEITDGKHIIERTSDGFIADLWNKTRSKTKESITIPIVPSLNNQIVQRDAYITIKDQ